MKDFIYANIENKTFAYNPWLLECETPTCSNKIVATYSWSGYEERLCLECFKEQISLARQQGEERMKYASTKQREEYERWLVRIKDIEDALEADNSSTG